MSSIFSKKEKNFSKNFTDHQVFEIVKSGSDESANWSKITEKLNKKWLINNTSAVYYGVFRRFSEEILKVFHSNVTVNPYPDLTRSALSDIKKINKTSKKRFVITSVGVGQALFTDGFLSLETYCKQEKAELVLLPLRAHVKALNDQPQHYDPYLRDYKKNFATEYTLNSRIKALELQINPQQVNPLTGIGRVKGNLDITDNLETEEVKIIENMQENFNKISLIVAHSKQMMQIKPTGNSSLPRMMHTTGAITKPRYRTDQRIGLIATEDHDLGAVIVEIDGNEFFVRQITINKNDGSFPSMGKRYHPDGSVTKESPKAFVMGDIHPGHEDGSALKIWQQIWKDQSPESIFLHDWFDGASCSHWLEHKKLSRALLPQVFKTIAEELSHAQKVLYEDVADKSPKGSKLYLVPSNHPDFLEKYLDSGRYMNDRPENYEISHRMVVSRLDGKHHLKPWLDPQKRFIWLERNEDKMVAGVNLNVHGDKGSNGAKGSKQNLEWTYTKAMSGHTHEPGIFHKLYTVGHSSLARHGYNEGASSWLLCSGNVYKDGAMELIIVINNKYKL